jgi:hypothetical protein
MYVLSGRVFRMANHTLVGARCISIVVLSQYEDCKLAKYNPTNPDLNAAIIYGAGRTYQFKDRG